MGVSYKWEHDTGNCFNPLEAVYEIALNSDMKPNTWNRPIGTVESKVWRETVDAEPTWRQPRSSGNRACCEGASANLQMVIILGIPAKQRGIPYWLFRIGYSLLLIPYWVFPVGYSLLGPLLLIPSWLKGGRRSDAQRFHTRVAATSARAEMVERTSGAVEMLLQR